MYYSLEKNKIIRFTDLQREYNVSLPPNKRAIDGELAEMLNLLPLRAKEKPSIDSDYQVITPDHTNITVENNVAYYNWKVTDVYVDVTDENGNVTKTKAEVKAEYEAAQLAKLQEAEAEAELQSRVTLFNRYKDMRNEYLLDTDKFSLPDWPHADETVRQAWLDYRQALRTMFDAYQPFDPEQTDPATITFPTRPDEVQESE